MLLEITEKTLSYSLPDKPDYLFTKLQIRLTNTHIQMHISPILVHKCLHISQFFSELNSQI